MDKTIQYKKSLVIWLCVVAFVIYLMILLGGVTRLTHSGLSMVDWKPIMGVIPPLNEMDWQETFSQYKAFPEYQKINHGMTLDEFKSIFYFEYFHRVLGRFIGILFLIPFLFFWSRGAISKTLLPKMIMMFVLGGCQGLLGWYMVKSGLVDMPQVSQYRLTAHLMAAVLIYSYILWVVFDLIKSSPDKTITEASKKLYNFACAICYLIAFMIFSGGLVAGTKAGLAYNTFPLMAGQWIPTGMYELQPFWLNWFENITTIQFNHRVLAYSLIVIIPLFSLRVMKEGLTSRSRLTARLLLMFIVIQFSLGIATLLLSVPVSIAAMHQGGAIILLTLALFIASELKVEKIKSPAKSFKLQSEVRASESPGVLQ